MRQGDVVKVFVSVVFSFSVSFLHLALAQSQVRVTGTVLHATTNIPIPGSSVYLIDAQGQVFPQSDEPTGQNVADPEGRFAIPDVPLDAWYGLEVYLGGSLLFSDTLFIGEGTVTVDPETQTAELIEPVLLTP